MSRRLIVGAAQTGAVLEESPRAMLPRARAVFAAAAAKGVEWLCFPEVFLTPFFPNRLEKNFERFFVSVDSEEISSLRAMAREFGIAAILPFAERANAGFFNSALVVDRDGTPVGLYRKTHIPAYFPTGQQGGTGSYEKFYFAPGDELPVFATSTGKIGIQICNDRLYPEASRVLAMKGAEIIFMPIAYSTYSDPDHRVSIWSVPLRARAYENGVFVVATNRVGQEGERRHLGRSMIIDPRGMVIAEAGDRDEELLTAEIDLDAVVAARKDFPWWRDRRPDLYRIMVGGS